MNYKLFKNISESILVLLLLSCITVSLVSCKDKEDDPLNDRNKLIGTWYHSYATTDNPARFIFNDDNSGVDIYNSANWSICWSLNNKILTVAYNRSDLQDLNLSGEVVSVTESRLQWMTDKYGLIVLYRNLYDCVGNGGSGSGGGTGGSSGGVAPSSLAGKTVYFYKDMECNTEYFNAEHYANGGAFLSINSTDYQTSPPTYEYSKTNSDTAKYTLSFTTKTYISLTQSYNYSPFRYEMILTFSANNKGKYKADYYNVYGLYKTLEGAFKIY